ncbi:hypothetical protein A3B45_03320 [Candidatus Daviesbacteria bacterium RIFCSPLOWO2_01_FULL_39_12]|uniref:Membrane protein 6-pyruvoyl-tetrahydropterin synthase-related domain-containing protein n=1 Tax=Candidatus Daviesbacteria bacterium RIFCSPLOWO2_01_FULL_39_12 TaxID=1797785 RepID=A0A1F5KS04_9BACT|nr:MAG: hypothetical protein A3B45_03320 [Candidatus Daviesbacteria bacterium RIFCSPLOWO2_01_FULL_39_12]
MTLENIKKNIYLILLLAFSLLVVWPLFLPGYFSHHDDLQVMRIFEMRKCFEDLQIPCRWVSDMGYGNGYPLFNYYNPFIYYVGGLLSFIFGFILSAKILFFMAALSGGISMYYLGKEIFGKEAGFVAAILYQFVPYKALDLYVRGALAESFAISIVPLCFLFAYKLIREFKVRYFIILTISLAILLTSHNIMTIFFIPTLILFCAFWIYIEKSKLFIPLILSLALGFGLSAFFTIPSFFEKDLVQIENLTRLDLDFRAHFVSLNQLFFDRSWGYGASSPGSDDTISFQIGWPHWWIVIASIISMAIYFKERSSKYALLILLVFIVAIFMTHIRSAFIWEKFTLLRFVQFPWRFLSVAVFSASLLGGFLVSSTSVKYKKYSMILIVTLAVVLNSNFFKPDQFYPNLSDQQKLSGQFWEQQQKAAILDYLPQTALKPQEAAPSMPIITFGQANIKDFKIRSNRFEFNIDVVEEAKIEVPIFDFPDWQVLANDKVIPHTQGTIGRIAFSLDRGEYLVEGQFENTLIRTLSNWVTIISFLLLLVIIFYAKDRKIFR